MRKRLLLILTMMILQLSVANICFASGNSEKTIYGFVFQDNDRNGNFDDSDNTFPFALINVQVVGSDSIETISVDSTGYFEAVELPAGEYYVWARHYELTSEKRIVEILSTSAAGMLVIGLSKIDAPLRNFDGPSLNADDSQGDAIVRTHDDPSLNVDDSQGDAIVRTHDDPSLNVDVPEAETDMRAPQVVLDTKIVQKDAETGASELNLSVMLPLISS